jgi:hypothetical protein
MEAFFKSDFHRDHSIKFRRVSLMVEMWKIHFVKIISNVFSWEEVDEIAPQPK